MMIYYEWHIKDKAVKKLFFCVFVSSKEVVRNIM